MNYVRYSKIQYRRKDNYKSNKKYIITYPTYKNLIKNKQIFNLFDSEKSTQFITADLAKCRMRNDNFE